MRELLVIYAHEEERVSLTEIGTENGFRVKATTEVETATHWLSARAFDACLLHLSIPLGERRRIAGALWHQKAEAPLVLYSLSHAEHEISFTEPLPGADVIIGPDAIPHISSLLRGIVTRGDEPPREVLVVEDLDPSRDIICACVESSRISVTGVASGREAIELLSANPRRFSCIVSDVRMPEMDGRELIALIRQHPHLTHLPIIVLTAFGSADALVDCLSAGATGFLLKPPKIKDLQREIERGFRVLERGADPRLLRGGGVRSLREALVDKGFV